MYDHSQPNSPLPAADSQTDKNDPPEPSTNGRAPVPDPAESLAAINAKQFLTMFGSEHFLELRAFHFEDPDRTPRRFFSLTEFTPGSPGDNFIRKLTNDHDVYFGVAERRTSENGKLKNCVLLRALFVDLDFKLFTDEGEARTRLSAFSIPPSIIVHSGGGLHLYWLLDEPLDPQLPLTKDLLRRLAIALNGDMSAAEGARVLRVPQTLNHKYDPPRNVVVELFQPDIRYNLDHFNFLPLEQKTSEPARRGRPRKGDPRRKDYSLEEVQVMLEKIPADDRGDWHKFGIILGRTFGSSDAAWKLYVDWADKWSGKKAPNHDKIMREAFYTLAEKQPRGSALSIATIVGKAIEHGWTPTTGSVPLERFIFNGPGNNFIYRPTISYWIAAAVDAAVSPVNVGKKDLMNASDWLRQHQLVTSCTADPTIDVDYVKGLDCRNGEIVAIEGAALFNFYRRPTIELGNADLAIPFVQHCELIFDKPGDAKQFLNYLAHRVQRPGEKPRFALLIGGDQGIGKDTAVEFCVPAIGVWNVAAIEPQAFDTGFNEYVAKTLVRINEAANLHEMSKWAFNERTKVLIAGSPDYVTVNPKYGNKYDVRMFCGVIVTTNHLMNGIYIPEGDRRFDVIECATMAKIGLADEDVRRKYFADLWQWFLNDGDRHVAAFLHERDISDFDPNQGQRKTAAHKTVVAINLASDSWLEEALDELGHPDVVCAKSIIQKAVAKGENEAAVKAKFSNAMGRAGYCLFTNPKLQTGSWTIGGRRYMVYAKVGIEQTADRINDLKAPIGF